MARITSYGNIPGDLHGDSNEPDDAVYAGPNPALYAAMHSQASADPAAAPRQAKALDIIGGLRRPSAVQEIDMEQTNDAGQVVPAMSRAARKGLSRLDAGSIDGALTDAQALQNKLTPRHQMTASFGGQDFSAMPRTRYSDDTMNGVVEQYLARKSKLDAQEVQNRGWAQEDKARADNNATTLATAKIGPDSQIALRQLELAQEKAKYDREHAPEVVAAENAGKVATAKATASQAEADSKGLISGRDKLAILKTEYTNALTSGDPERIQNAANALQASQPGTGTPGVDANSGEATTTAGAPGGAFGALGKPTSMQRNAQYDNAVKPLQDDIQAMLAEVGTHTMRYGPSEQARTQVAKDQIIAKAKSLGMPPELVTRLTQELDQKTQQKLAVAKPYKSTGDAALGILGHAMALPSLGLSEAFNPAETY